VLLKNTTVVDAERAEPEPGRDVRIAGGIIAEIEPRLGPFPDEDVVDLGGLYLAPGLIDAHVHVVDFAADRYTGYGVSPYYVASRAQAILRGMLDRGFTTVRDAAGADAGLARAVAEGCIDGPTLFPSGRAISQTGGHGDLRLGDGPVSAADHPMMGAIADGLAAVQHAVREELRRGASQIKMMIGGGIDSPRDQVTSTQYTVEEIAAAVAEAKAAGTYVMAHAYTEASIVNGLAGGVRSIEHGNFLDEAAARRMAAQNTFLVPTLIVYQTMCEQETRAPLPAPGVSFQDVLDAGHRSLEIARRAGVKMVFGTDLMGGTHELQSAEFRLRREVLPQADIFRSATATAADLLGLPGQLGAVRPGATADVLVLDANPLEDVAALADPRTHLKAVIKTGRLARSWL
jgi:imidazolonepropionase-like amidohydrolase